MRNIGVHNLCEQAATIITERGYTTGMYINPHTGAVDLKGALLLAAGADERRLFACDGDPEQCRVPPIAQGRYHGAVYVLEALAGAELEAWADQPGRGQVEAQALLAQAARRIAIAVG